MVRLDWTAAGSFVHPWPRAVGQIARIAGRRGRRLKDISCIGTRLDVLFLAREVIIVAFGATLGADGTRLATRALALTRLARGTGDSRAFSVGIGIHGGEWRSRREIAGVSWPCCAQQRWGARR